MSNKYTYSIPFTEQQLTRCYQDEGMTQTEIAERFGTTQKVVWNAMRRFGIPARVPFKRNQRGSNNSSWRGDAATYTAFHNRVTAAKGQPKHCEECGTTDPSKTYDWANLSGNYADINDYKRMCRSCHWKLDDKIQNITKNRKEVHAHASE
jgi:hypothetical protein